MKRTVIYLIIFLGFSVISCVENASKPSGGLPTASMSRGETDFITEKQ